MDLLYAVRDRGVTDPTSDMSSAERMRAALAREIEAATAAPAPRRRRRAQPRMRWTVPALAVGAAAAAVAVVVGVGGSREPRSLGGGSSARSIVVVPLAHAQNAADIIRRVSAHVATEGRGDVARLVSTSGSVTNTDTFYTDPGSGVQYSQQVGTSAGNHLYTYVTVATPVNGGVRTQTTLLDPVRRAYAVTSSTGPDTGSDNGPSPAQTKRALDSGQATVNGRATVDGQSTFKLTVPQPRGSALVLFVNSQTYRLVQEDASSPSTGVYTWNWLPATQANIASAKPVQIPSGYARTSMSTLNRQATQGQN